MRLHVQPPPPKEALGRSPNFSDTAMMRSRLDYPSTLEAQVRHDPQALLLGRQSLRLVPHFFIRRAAPHIAIRMDTL